jgi:hypothetical protein
MTKKNKQSFHAVSKGSKGSKNSSGGAHMSSKKGGNKQISGRKTALGYVSKQKYSEEPIVPLQNGKAKKYKDYYLHQISKGN